MDETDAEGYLVGPGGVLEYDYRPPERPVASASLKVLQWNVERNYESQRIMDTIKELDPDVCVLQEVDIGCRRSDGRNHMKELCKELQMYGVFVCEFWELASPLRKERDQGGGIHGNAILSKYDMRTRVLNHHVQPYDWDNEGAALGEPRKGRRFTLAATVQPGTHHAVLLYNVHLEASIAVFTGIIGRVSAFSEILEDAREQTEATPHQGIFGDLNTMGHSIARLSSKYARDRYRWLSLGWTEAEWWNQQVLAWHDQDGPVNLGLLTVQGCVWWLKPLAWSLRFLVNHRFSRTWGQSLGQVLSGFSWEVLCRARNPGFFDPWPSHHVTLHNPAYFGLFRAKLDWTLVRNLVVQQRWVGNQDYSASDHQWLMVELDTSKVIPQDGLERRHQWQASRTYWAKS
ncbi:hypothetical protein DM01DRAFT_1409638 [Hesseltinella vesiculosa]|uniref:Endonuclease/exonuclease/phosphatase domain-containing protein n=1 Tax=Hesseltinella vesiculosa TaxID=101127 RepID=A0A1X2GAL5_9FUNG|nr:hypothetical protein DM01DRAFT_1409638 [Hesseltinella vesiculosa]